MLNKVQILMSLLCLTCLMGGCEDISSDETVRSEEAMEIASGVVTGTRFYDTYSLTSKNRKSVNFWIQNNGTNSVKISINEDETRKIEPGQQGHISTDVESITTDYTFRAVSAENGGDINIEYKIAQVD